MNGLALFIAVFLACAVEAVEATTIVLAAGTARDWKSSLLGTGAGLGVLVVIIGAFGPSISKLPINSMRLFVGGLLLVFGLQWVRKAILRASGYKALHDEELIFQEELAAAKAAKAGKRFGVADWYAYTLSFKGVLLEGLEVAFIVLTFGTIQKQVGLASIAALAAVVVVAAGGFALRKPLARVPENKMKYIVGIMLTSFGIFWGAEGAGAEWPHADLSILGILIFMVIVTQALIYILKRQKDVQVVRVPAGHIADVADFDEADVEAIMEDRGVIKLVKDFGYFWYDFLIGDDLIGTAIVLAAMEATYLLHHHSGSNAWYVLPIAVAFLLPVNLFRVTR
ncbi:MAG: hypothetical protein NT057_00955 [Actinobacteria bacterium]|nr:hypothetical protein [Actinomycetota bacterium]